MPHPPPPPLPQPTQMGHIRPAAPARQPRTRAAGQLVAHPSPAWTLHPIPTPGKSHCLILVRDHAGAEWDQAAPEKTPAAEGPAALVSHGIACITKTAVGWGGREGGGKGEGGHLLDTG